MTEARITSGKAPGIVAGTAPNHLATEAAWTKAIEECTDEVPPEGDWQGIDGDGEQFVNSLARVELAGWVARGKIGQVAVTATTNKKYVGGTSEVTGCEFGSDDE